MTKENTTKIVRFARPVGIVALSLLMIGCATDQGRTRSGQTVTSVADTRTALLDADKEIQQSLDAIAKLEALPSDLLPPFNTYKKEVADVKKQAANVRSAALDMRTRSLEYRSSWRTDIGSLSNEELRQSAEDRAKRVEERFDRVNALYGETNDAFAPFITDLDDLQKFLSNDLTFNGVKAADPAIRKAREDAEKLRGKISELVSALETTKNAMSPTTTPAS